MADIQSWEASVIGKHLDTDGVLADAGQCSQVPISWVETLFPGIGWPQLLPALGSDAGVDKWAGRSTAHMAWIWNDHADIHQLPVPGDVMVFGVSKAHPLPHTGVCKASAPTGFTLIQQNAPLGSGVNEHPYTWSALPCLGWFRPVGAVAIPAPVAVTPTQKTVVVQAGWGLERVAEHAGMPDPQLPTTWERIAVANGNPNWQDYNAHLQPGQIVHIPS